MEMNEPRALHVTEGEGKKLWVADELMAFKASGKDTGGAYALTDSVVPPGGGPPPHLHHREDEAFWVLEGELEVTAGGPPSGPAPARSSTCQRAYRTPTGTSARGPRDSSP
jgi:mannose-6-phosphate isomerase-like protein (cupin superfamily)